jgi:hypothetical protein
MRRPFSWALGLSTAEGVWYSSEWVFDGPAAGWATLFEKHRREWSSSVLCTRAALRRPSDPPLILHKEGYSRTSLSAYCAYAGDGLEQPRQSRFRTPAYAQ